MSRELKFRIWDKTKKCFPIDGQIYLIDAIKGYRKNLIAEQYIGLKDIHGKEIYEGDIVEVFSTDEYEMDFEGVCRVYFDDYWLSYQMYKIKSPYTKITFEPEMYDNIEIIGNIHENPELLGGKE